MPARFARFIRFHLGVLVLALASGWAAAADLDLSEEERSHLQALGQARVCVDPHYAPFEQLDEQGHYTGIAAEFLGHYSRMLDLPMQIQLTHSWAESLQWMEQGKCDLMAMLNETPARHRFMNFSTPYLQDDTLIITRDDIGYLEGVGALRGKKVGIVPGYRLEELIRRDYPEVDIVSTKTVSEALERVSTGELFATFEALRSALPMIQQQGLGNLKISGQTPYQNVYRVGVRKDDLLLLSAINKAIAALPPLTAHEIVERGFKVPVTRQIDYTRLLQLTAVAAVLLAFLLYRNYKIGQFNRILAEKNAELERLSETDHLTGSYNRLKLDRELQQEVERAHRYQRPLSVILFDLDLFKQINDQHGHPVGDKVLVEIAALVQQQIRQHDRCGRWGGEEFLIICPETALDQAAQLAEKLRSALAKHIVLDRITVTGSFGVASLQPAESVASLIQRVDQAQYDAKHAGRNSLCTAAA